MSSNVCFSVQIHTVGLGHPVYADQSGLEVSDVSCAEEEYITCQMFCVLFTCNLQHCDWLL
jgi:hypothetical protein